MNHSLVKGALPANIRLRPMQETDLPGVHRLEVTSQPVPWPLWYFRGLLRQGVSCWVLEENKEIVGFGIVAFAKLRAHIMNMCVAPEYRRRGLGRRIMLHLQIVARQHHCRWVWLEVRPTNRPAIVLYRKLGFRAKQVLKGYYPNRMGRQNGLLMACPIRKRGQNWFSSEK
jgi:ribosomal-protein-alanine N-acetyltransferase